VGAIFAGIIVFSAVGYLAYNANWEEILATWAPVPVRVGKALGLGLGLRKSKDSKMIGKVVPFDPHEFEDAHDDGTASMSFDESTLYQKNYFFDDDGSMSTITTKKKRNDKRRNKGGGGAEDDGTVASSISSWTRGGWGGGGAGKVRVVPVDHDEDELELLDLDSIGGNEEGVELVNGPETDQEDDEITWAADSSWADPASFAPEDEEMEDRDSDLDSFSLASLSTAGTRRTKPRHHDNGGGGGHQAKTKPNSKSKSKPILPKLSKEERQKLIKQKQHEKSRLRAAIKVGGVVVLDDGGSSGGDGDDSIATSLSVRFKQEAEGEEGEEGEEWPGAGQQQPNEQEQSTPRREDLCIVDIFDEQQEEEEQEVELELGPTSPSPFFAAPVGSPLRPIAAASIEEGKFERKKNSKHLSGARPAPSSEYLVEDGEDDGGAEGDDEGPASPTRRYIPPSVLERQAQLLKSNKPSPQLQR